MPSPPTQPCWRCGASFEPAQADSKYCGKVCRDAIRMARSLAVKTRSEPPAAHPTYVAWVEDARAAEQASADARLAAADAERQRRLRCPRPDKQAWLTREAADDVIRLMRASSRPRASGLHAYACPCGAFHAGSKAVYEQWVDPQGSGAG